jgi:hypothetical protein
MPAVSRTPTAALMQLAAGRALAALPPRAQSALGGGIPERIDGQSLDPGIRLLRTLAMRGGAVLVPGPDADPVAVREQRRRDGVAVLARPTPVGAVFFGEGFFLDRLSMDWFRAQHLPVDADPADPRLSPLRAGDLGELPPALVLTAAFDPLRDEGEAVCHRFPGLIHGLINLTAVSRAALHATIALAGMIRGALVAPTPSPALDVPWGSAPVVAEEVSRA